MNKFPLSHPYYGFFLVFAFLLIYLNPSVSASELYYKLTYTENDLKVEFKKLITILKEVEKVVDKKNPTNKKKLQGDLSKAQKSIKQALEVLDKKKQEGGRRRETRRKQHRKIRRKKRRRRYSKRLY